MQVIVNNLLAHYERSGAGKTVLILPGWADTTRSWSGVMSKLSQDYEVIALDLPGFGGSQQPTEAWGLNEYAAFVAAFLTKLNVSDVYGIIGHSNGGAIALRGLATERLTADRLVLLASAGIRNQGSSRKQSLRMIAKVGKAVSAPLPSSVRQRLRQRLYSSIGSDLLVAEHMQESFKLVVSDDVQADTSLLRMPTLLVYGEADTETPLSYGQAFHRLIPGSKLQTVAQAGHFLHLDAPGRVVKEIREFLG